MTAPTGRLGDACSHGATIIGGSNTRLVDGIPVARLGDMIYCPIPGHGVNPLIAISTEVITEGKLTMFISGVAASGSSDTLTG
jgi:uncharacterized Zn-binding protein involved in type VI secretion